MVEWEMPESIISEKKLASYTIQQSTAQCRSDWLVFYGISTAMAHLIHKKIGFVYVGLTVENWGFIIVFN